MAAAPRLKLADKQEIYKKLLAGLKKRYPAQPKPPELPVLETMLFAVCLENATVKEADNAYKKMLAAFHDLNEIRVSSIDELEVAFQGMSDPDWRASRIRGILGYVFEANYSFEYEGLKRKTLELATKQLSKIKELTPFIRDFTLHAALGAHLIPLDGSQHAVLEFLDLQAETGGPEQTAESMRPLVRKAEGAEFCGLLREFALDPKFRPQFGIVKQISVNEGATLPPPLVRLDKLLKGETIKYEGGQPRKAPEKKVPEKKAPPPPAPVPVVAKKSEPVVDKKGKPAPAPAKAPPAKPAVQAKAVESKNHKPAPAAPAPAAAKSSKPTPPKPKPVPAVAKKQPPKKPAPPAKAAAKPATKPAAKPTAKPGKKQPAKSGK